MLIKICVAGGLYFLSESIANAATHRHSKTCAGCLEQMEFDMFTHLCKCHVKGLATQFKAVTADIQTQVK